MHPPLLTSDADPRSLIKISQVTLGDYKTVQAIIVIVDEATGSDYAEKAGVTVI